MNRSLQAVAIAAMLFFVACDEAGNTGGKNPTKPKPTSKKETQEEAPKPPVKITYHAFSLKDTGYKVFKAQFTPEQRTLILALNRLDAANYRRADTLVVPDSILTDWMAYSPYPAGLDVAKDVKKLVLFSYPIQAFGVYENGKLVHWGPTSMGKKSTPTPTGLFFANWKALEIHSTVNDEWVLKWNFNISNKGGVGWHQYALPGYPASHSCLRLLESDAKWMYNWGDMWVVRNDQMLASGTPAIVFGEYPWGQPRPWKALLQDGAANYQKPEDLKALIEPLLSKILQKQHQRDSVVAAISPAQQSASDTNVTISH